MYDMAAALGEEPGAAASPNAELSDAERAFIDFLIDQALELLGERAHEATK